MVLHILSAHFRQWKTKKWMLTLKLPFSVAVLNLKFVWKRARTVFCVLFRIVYKFGVSCYGICTILARGVWDVTTNTQHTKLQVKKKQKQNHNGNCRLSNTWKKILYLFNNHGQFMGTFMLRMQMILASVAARYSHITFINLFEAKNACFIAGDYHSLRCRRGNFYAAWSRPFSVMATRCSFPHRTNL